MDSTQYLLWNGVEIGYLEHVVMDMWYVEGDFISNQSHHAQKFEKLSSTLQNPAIFEMTTNPTILTIVGSSSSAPQTRCLLLGATSNQLFLRIVSDEAIERFK